MNEARSDQSPLEIAEIVSTLGERYVLDILDTIAEAPLSAKAIARDADIPTTTLYRRLDALVEVGLVEETMQLDDDGDHYHVYRATLDHLSLSRGDDGIEVDVAITTQESPTETWNDTMTAFEQD